MSQYIMLGEFDLRGKAFGGFKLQGGTWGIKQDGATSLKTGARRDVPNGSILTFSVIFTNEDEASEFLAYCEANQEDADIPLYIRSEDWHYSVWGVQVTPQTISGSPMDYTHFLYDVQCILYSPYTYYQRPQTWKPGVAVTLPQTKNFSNRNGHIASSIESLHVVCNYSAGHVQDLDLDFGGDALALAARALSSEVWTFYLNENRILEQYEDAITSGTKWAQDWTGNGAYSGGAMILNNAESAYIRLSGPHPARWPVKMIADLSLDSGGSTGKAHVEISADGLTWVECLDELDLESGSSEYRLNGTEFMTDIYVRLRCESGTSGKYLRCNSISFEVERWIQEGIIPLIEASQGATATLDASTGSHSVLIDAEFYPRRRYL